MLIATLLKFINDVIFSWRESYELWRDTKCMVLFLSMTVLLLLTNSLVFGLLQEPRVLLCLCLATSSLWLLRRLLRPLVRLLEQRDWRRWQRWRQQQAGQAGALLAPTLDPILEQQRRDFTPLNRNVGATVTQEGIGGMLPDTPSQRQQQPYQQQQHRQPPESQRMSAEQDQTDRLPFTTC